MLLILPFADPLFSILYQSVHQAVDSLHSYIAAVYLDVQHLLAWTNLACLYESVMQPM